MKRLFFTQHFFVFRVNWEIDLVAQQYSISVQVTNAPLNDIETVQANRIKYVYIYALLIVAALYLVFQRALTLYIFCLKASRRIHEQLLQSVMHASMYFFNTNSSGRIINRFSRDLYDIDYYLALVLYDVTLVNQNKSVMRLSFEFDVLKFFG